MAQVRFQTCHSDVEPMPVHRHAQAYLALVERGSYLEFTADGVFRCEPGMAVVHPTFHLHGNRFFETIVEVTNIVVASVSRYGVFRLEGRQVEELKRAREMCVVLDLLRKGEPVAPEPVPAVVEAVARSLRSDPRLRIDRIAAEVEQSPEHLCRQFKRRP